MIKAQRCLPKEVELYITNAFIEQWFHLVITNRQRRIEQKSQYLFTEAIDHIVAVRSASGWCVFRWLD